MIAYPTLGQVGRLGNHLFQIAATVGLALDHKEDYGFPPWVHAKDFPIEGCFLENIPNGPLYREQVFNFSPIQYQPHLRLQGYFQSEKYFQNHADVIRTMLTPHCARSVNPIRATGSIHVRRGDYLLLPEHHPIVPLEYYERAIEMARQRGANEFLVFSDDLPWCREHFRFPSTRVVPDMGPLQQLALTIACGYHIMANSTFSWWGAWLDPDPEKVVIAPGKWFGPGYSHFDTRDLIPGSWMVL